MMTKSTRKRSLSLGSRYRRLLAFAVLLPALLSGVTAAWAEAPIFTWDGTVEVEGSTTVTLKAGERTSYRLRLTKPLPVVDGERQEGWWVRVHVDGAVRSSGSYDPDDPGNANPDDDNWGISWVPSVGWQFDPDDWTGMNQESDWREVSITAHRDLDTPIRFMHDVLDKDSNCPPYLHPQNLPSVSVGFSATPPPPPPPPPLLPNAVAPTVTIGMVTSVADDATLDLTAEVAGGTYDTDTYEWAVVSGGGSITGAGSTATYIPPDVATETAVEVRVTVTARGTGTNAANGTSATASDTESFTVTDSGTPLLPNAVAPTVTIGMVTSVADDATLDLTAEVAGGTYDTDTYEWAVVSGGGSITGAGSTATYTPPDVATETAVEVRVTVTARGTGTNAANGTSATASDTESFTVTDSGTPLLPNAVAPTVTIGMVTSVADDATLDLTAEVAGGTYDTDTYEWAVVSGGGSITGAGSTATYTPPDVATETAVEVRVTVTARGTGTNAANGTSATASDTESFTVTDSGTPLLPNAVAPTVTIGMVTSVADDATLDLTAEVAGGTYDTDTYEWAVVSGGGSITGAGSTATYTPPDVATETAVEVRVTVTARGTGTNAANGTSATASDTESFTVTDSGTPLLPNAVAPTVTIGMVTSVADDATLDLTAEVAGGTYDDTLTYEWAVVSGGGSISGAGATATYTPPDVSTETAVEVSLTVTARGTGTIARAGTSDTETDTEPFTVTDSGTMPSDGDGGNNGNNGENGNNLVDNGGNGGNGENGGKDGDGGTGGTGDGGQTGMPSSDATLKSLVLSHETNIVPLAPRFMPETTMYTATVESDVPQLTVTATPNHSGAQIAYLDGDDKELTDSSASDNGFQVELPVGDTVIQVKVTAEDGTTMQTYTVTVTRVVGLARNREGVGHEWLARFARTVGTQVVNVVGERFVAPRRPGLAGQVAGQDLSRLVRASVQPDDAPETRVRPGAGLAEYAPGRSDSRILTGRDFLSGTSFTLTMGQEDGLSAALWGRGAIMRFDGRDGDLLLDGEVSTGMLGVDYARGAVTGGLLLGLNRGEGDYQSPTGDGELDSLLVGVYPYARVEVSERISAWGLFGHGRGNVTLTPDNQAPIKTDIGLHMGALGVEGMLSDSSGPTGLDLTLKSDAMWVRIESDEAVGLDSTHAKVSRLRLMIEGVRVFEVAPGATLTPSGQIGLRHDEGDAETGFGLDMSAGIRYAAGRLTIEGTVRTLVAHEDSAYEEWGASGAIRMTPDALGRGLSLTVAPAWGNTASKAEQLWAGQAPTGLATTDPTRPGIRLNAEFGYGMVSAADYRGILTPYAGLSLGDGSSQSYRTGARWQMAPETTLALEASHAMAALSPAPVNSVMLHAAWRW